MIRLLRHTCHNNGHISEGILRQVRAYGQCNSDLLDDSGDLAPDLRSVLFGNNRKKK